MLPPNDDRPKRSSRVNLSNIESAHRLVPIELHSDEAQHAFKRRFYMMQLNVNELLVHGFNRLPHSVVEEARELMRLQLEKSAATLNGAAIEAEQRLGSAGITALETYRQDPLVEPVMVFSRYGKRYLELICKFDMLMLMLAAMVIHKLISTVEMDQRKARLKTELRHVANLVRDLCRASKESASALSSLCKVRAAGASPSPDWLLSQPVGSVANHDSPQPSDPDQ